MPSQKSRKKPTRRHYSPEFKNEALGLAEQVGAVGAAKQLGLHQSQLYAWRKKARYEASRSETEKELEIENAMLKRQLAQQAEEIAILKKESAYFAKSMKWSTRSCSKTQAHTALRHSVLPLACHVAGIMAGGAGCKTPVKGRWSVRDSINWRKRPLTFAGAVEEPWG